MCGGAGLEACLLKVQGLLACGSDEQVHMLLLHLLCWLQHFGHNFCTCTGFIILLSFYRIPLVFAVGCSLVAHLWRNLLMYLSKLSK